MYKNSDSFEQNKRLAKITCRHKAVYSLSPSFRDHKMKSAFAFDFTQRHLIKQTTISHFHVFDGCTVNDAYKWCWSIVGKNRERYLIEVQLTFSGLALYPAGSNSPDLGCSMLQKLENYSAIASK